MSVKALRHRGLIRAMLISLLAAPFISLICVSTAVAQNGSAYFYPGNLVVSRSVYDNNPNNIQVGMTLPPDCTNSCVQAVVDGTYPFVWNNAPVDGSFGITSKIFLDQITTTGGLINSLEVPDSFQKGVPPTKDQMVTSFSSKSELALNLSMDGRYLTFMGYLAPINALDVSKFQHTWSRRSDESCWRECLPRGCPNRSAWQIALYEN